MVVVNTSAAHFHRFSVELEAFFRRIRNQAHSERMICGIGHFPADRNFRVQAVQIRVVQIPQVRIVQSERKCQGRFLSFYHICGSHHRRHGVSLMIPHRCRHRRFGAAIRRQLVFYTNRMFIGRGDEGIPRLDAHFAALPKEHITVHARAGIPTRGRLFVVCMQANFIVTGKQPIGQIDQKRSISVRVKCHRSFIDKHLRTHIGAVDVQNPMYFSPIRGQNLRIIRRTADKEPVRRAAGGFRVARLHHRVVVRKIDFLLSERRRFQIPIL